MRAARGAFAQRAGGQFKDMPARRLPRSRQTAFLFSALRLPRIGKRPAKAERLPPIGDAGGLIDVADEAGRRGRREAVGEAIPSQPRQSDIVGVMRPVARRHGEQMADFLEPAADFLDRVANGEIGYPLLFGEAVRLVRRGMHIDFEMYDVGAGCHAFRHAAHLDAGEIIRLDDEIVLLNGISDGGGDDKGSRARLGLENRITI
jgi:hypothetical protein